MEERESKRREKMNRKETAFICVPQKMTEIHISNIKIDYAILKNPKT